MDRIKADYDDLLTRLVVLRRAELADGDDPVLAVWRFANQMEDWEITSNDLRCMLAAAVLRLAQSGGAA
jgi:hypothetical protein